jgi:predicted RNA-binding Zn-ribbon protein involved in translation (DUF1610 family)
MTSCTHLNLVLLPEAKDRLRCRYCNLTIQADELTTRYCPECFETSNTRRYDFEAIKVEATGIVRYRCEDCGILIECP